MTQTITQWSLILEYMQTNAAQGKWVTLSDIAGGLGYGEASISAQLRNLRKPRYGSHVILRRSSISGPEMWEYMLQIPIAKAAENG